MNDGRAPHGARGLKSFLAFSGAESCSSRPARGAWIEIADLTEARHGAASRPARGAWIEIPWDFPVAYKTGGRAPHGARGLKCCRRIGKRDSSRRAPHGARGLKY